MLFKIKTPTDPLCIRIDEIIYSIGTRFTVSMRIGIVKTFYLAIIEGNHVIHIFC